MQTLKNNIRLVTFQAPAVLDEDNSPITATVIDTKELNSNASPSFDGALIRALVGTFGADVTAVKVKIHESANSNGSSSSLAEGGDEQTLAATGALTFEIKRTKRYLVAIITMTATGTTDTAPVCIVGLLHNWAKPFPLI
jgi:hypothetical protein